MAQSRTYRLTDCTPETLVNLYPCLECASDSQLLIVLMWLLAKWNEDYDLPTDLDTLLADAACTNCMSERQKRLALIAMIADYVGVEEMTSGEIMDELKCLACLKPAQVTSMILIIMCKLFQSLEVAPT